MRVFTTNYIYKIVGLIALALLLVALKLSLHGVGAISVAKAATACPAGTGDGVTSSISVPSSASYTIWSRIQIPDAAHTSFYLEVDGDCVGAVGGNASLPFNQWSWVNYLNGTASTKITRQLSNGNHSIRVIGKDAGVKLDRVILASDNCTPNGLGDNCMVTTTITPTPIPTRTPSPSPTSTPGGGASAGDMKGIWAVKQFNSQTGTGGAFASNTMDANIAGYSARMPWKLIQTGQNKFNWAAYDALVSSAKAKGKKVRLSVMSGANAPDQGSWVSYQYPWFKGSQGSQCDSAGVTIPVPWDSGLLNAQTTLINEMARKWKSDWGSTVIAMQVTGPSAKWEELCLPNNTVDQQDYYYNSRADNVIRKTWTTTMDKWKSALTAQGISSNKMFVAVSGPPPFYAGLSDDVANDAIARFGDKLSLQWHYLDIGFAGAVNNTTNSWKGKAIVGWQEWGATAFASRLLGTGGGTKCNTVLAADCDVNSASSQDVKALNASLSLAKDAGASYIEVYDDDLKFPTLSDAAATMHAQMKDSVTPSPTPTATPTPTPTSTPTPTPTSSPTPTTTPTITPTPTPTPPVEPVKISGLKRWLGYDWFRGHYYIQLDWNNSGGKAANFLGFARDNKNNPVYSYFGSTRGATNIRYYGPRKSGLQNNTTYNISIVGISQNGDATSPARTTVTIRCNWFFCSVR